MPAPAIMADLVQRFHEHVDSYKRGVYNETQVRREFVDPMFKALGWDVDNTAGYAEAYKDVIHEDAVKVSGGTTAPDYGFRIGGVRKFFVEAKKPSVDIKGDVHPAYQLRRYAWSAKLPLSILTDFEEFAVYDCRSKPAASDQPSVARVLYLTYQDYLTRWDEIAGVFSREAILKGAFDQYAADKGGKRGTTAVDVAFLGEIERWRDLLARNIALRNPTLSQRELNFAVQQTIDRIIFLRIGEDRGSETYGTLLGLVNGGQVYARLLERFRLADARYNAGLFHFGVEKDRPEPPDTLTPRLALDDKTLKEILTSLYYPDSPYEFSVLPADLLGQVYEQFLGKVIRLTAGHQAKVEEKPEVRKAGGVFYTPTFIVDAIVRKTVGRLVEDRSLRQVAGETPGGSPLRLLDMACGSGSFMLGAYQFLLDWYRDRYVADGPEKWASGRHPRLYQARYSDWRLTIAERKRILLSHIYGVDIDPQAVEVTKLSLLLKVLEGENEQTIGQQLALFPTRVLPDLSRNIKCGNSLIGPDFYAGRQLGLLDDDAAMRLNVFDWTAEFPEVFGARLRKSSETSEVLDATEGRRPPSPSQGEGRGEGRRPPSPSQGEGRGEGSGFDAIIGNPPYIRIQALKEWAPLEVEYYKQRYRAAGKGNYDIYVVFVEKALSLLNAHGRLGFILPHKFFNAQYGEPLRGLLAEGRHLDEIVHFGDQQVFSGATTYTCLLFLEKEGRQQFNFVKAHDLAGWRQGQKQVAGEVDLEKVTAAEWNFSVGSGTGLFERLREMQSTLGLLARIFVGTQTSADTVFVLDSVRRQGDVVIGVSAAKGGEVAIEHNIVKPFLRGREIRRYEPLLASSVLICPYIIESNKSHLISEHELAAQYPLAYTYLRSCRSALSAREKGKFRGDNWFAFGYPKSMTSFQLPKIVVPDYNNMASFTLDEGQHFFKTGYGILTNAQTKESPLYLLGLLNSPLLFQHLLKISTTLRGGYVRFWAQYIEQLPIRTIDFSNPADVARHDEMVALVERMLALQRKLAAESLPHVKTALQRQIEATDRQIDQAVYTLYGLTHEEIGMVEDAAR